MVQEFSRKGKGYRHIREIADGGMGSVSLAAREDGRFRRVYAVKRLQAAYRNDPYVRSMFVEEARIAGLLHHPNVVSVVDIGEDADGPYLVMDYVQGVSLAELIATSGDRKELLPVQICVRIIEQVARGLHAAHELAGPDGQKLELVHRDVSPQNVLVGYDGVARLTDFGIAKALGRPDRTNTGILKGKFGYFSPEQLRFEEPTRRSDIFALGITLFETLSATRLYGGENASQIARRILNESPPDIDEMRSDVHPALVELLFRMLTKEPECRPATAEEVATRLDAVCVKLAASEGTMLVSQYVSRRFEERQARQKKELSEITQGLALNRTSTTPSPPRARGKRAMYLMLLGAALAGAVGLALVSRDDPTPPARVEQPKTPPIPAPEPPIVEMPAVVEPTEPEVASVTAKKVQEPKRRPRKARPPKKQPARTKSPEPAKPAKAPSAVSTTTPATRDLAGWNEE